MVYNRKWILFSLFAQVLDRQPYENIFAYFLAAILNKSHSGIEWRKISCYGIYSVCSAYIVHEFINQRI